MTKKKTLAGLLVALIMMVLYFGADSLLGGETIDLGFSIVRFIISIGGIIAMAKLYGTDFKFRGKDVLKGLLSASALFFLAECVENFFEAWQKPEIGFMQALPGIIIVLIWGIGVGIFEEVLCRGVLFNTFRYRMGESRSSIIKSIVLSSTIFGCLHFANLIAFPHLVVSTCVQVAYAIVIGATLACVYYITDNIWVVSILHALMDIAAAIMGCFVVSGVQVFSDQDMTILEGIKTLGVSVTFTVIAFILLFREFKKRKIEN
ncbi:MAG: CPBP family intramembrane metalloprotease [Butyrivibrio sp.]|nr:CPBP family intramembrane metalloprotease [Butyrivibrio sp.]